MVNGHHHSRNQQLSTSHSHWMRRCIVLAESAGQQGEVPVGALIVDSKGQLLAEGENRRERDCDPTAHAEIIALRAAGSALGSWRLDHCILYVTLEPCIMCAGALVLSRIGQVVYGTDDPKTGAVHTVLNIPTGLGVYHRFPVVRGVLAKECKQQLHQWFVQRRKEKKTSGILKSIESDPSARG